MQGTIATPRGECQPNKASTEQVVAKSIKALNHKEHKGKENLFSVLFVVPFFSGPFATPSEMSVNQIWAVTLTGPGRPEP